jgi:hypothetical protein
MTHVLIIFSHFHSGAFGRAPRIGNRRPFSMAFGVPGVNGSNDRFVFRVRRAAFFCDAGALSPRLDAIKTV